MTLKATKRTNVRGAHAAGPPEASPTAVHTVGHEAGVTAGPDPDLLATIIAGHLPTADQTLTIPRKQEEKRRNHWRRNGKSITAL